MAKISYKEGKPIIEYDPKKEEVPKLTKSQLKRLKESERTKVYSELAKIRAERAIALDKAGEKKEADKNIEKYEFFKRIASEKK